MQPELFKTDPIAELLGLSNQASTLEAKYKDIEDELKVLKSDIDHIRCELMPAIMEENDIYEITLSNGQRIMLRSFPVGSISESNSVQALRWLRENGHGGVIKNQIIAELARGQDGLVDQVFAALAEQGITTISQKESVHPSTLKSLLREIALEPEFPRDLFKVHDVKQVVVK